MADNLAEKVDWVVPVASKADIGKTPVSNLIKATEQHGVEFDIEKHGGKTFARVTKKVVEGMPAPGKVNNK